MVKDGRNTDSKGTQIGRGGFENNKCPGWVRSKDGNAPNKEEEDKKIAVDTENASVQQKITALIPKLEMKLPQENNIKR